MASRRGRWWVAAGVALAVALGTGTAWLLSKDSATKGSDIATVIALPVAILNLVAAVLAVLAALWQSPPPATPAHPSAPRAPAPAEPDQPDLRLDQPQPDHQLTAVYSLRAGQRRWSRHFTMTAGALIAGVAVAGIAVVFLTQLGPARQPSPAAPGPESQRGEQQLTVVTGPGCVQSPFAASSSQTNATPWSNRSTDGWVGDGCTGGWATTYIAPHNPSTYTWSFVTLALGRCAIEVHIPTGGG